MWSHSQLPSRVVVGPLCEGMLLGLSSAVLLVPQSKIGSEQVSSGKVDKVHSMIRKAKLFLKKKVSINPGLVFFPPPFPLLGGGGSALNLK